MVAVALGACGFGMAIHILEADPAVNDSLALLLRNLGHEVLSHQDAASQSLERESGDIGVATSTFDG